MQLSPSEFGSAPSLHTHSSFTHSASSIPGRCRVDRSGCTTDNLIQCTVHMQQEQPIRLRRCSSIHYLSCTGRCRYTDLPARGWDSCSWWSGCGCRARYRRTPAACRHTPRARSDSNTRDPLYSSRTGGLKCISPISHQITSDVICQHSNCLCLEQKRASMIFHVNKERECSRRFRVKDTYMYAEIGLQRMYM